MYPPQRAGRAGDDDPRPRAAPLPRVGDRPHAVDARAQVRERRPHLRRDLRQLGVHRRRRRRDARFPTRAHRRRAPGIGAEFTPAGTAARSRPPVPADRRDARAAEEPRHAGRGLRAARRPRARARRRRRTGLGRAAAARPPRRRPARPRLRRASSRASTAAPPPSPTRPASRASGCRSPRRWRPARRSSPRRTPRSTRPAATRRSAPTPRARRRSPPAIRDALARHDELRGAGARACGDVLLGADRRALPRGVPAIRVGIDTTPLVQTRAGTARYVRGLLAHLEVPVSTPGLRRVDARSGRSRWTRFWYPRLRIEGVDVLHCPTFRGPFSSPACRSSSPSTTSPCSGIRSGSTAGRARTRASPCRASSAPPTA